MTKDGGKIIVSGKERPGATSAMLDAKPAKGRGQSGSWGKPAPYAAVDARGRPPGPRKPGGEDELLEKSLLLRELQHRVKNSMSLITALVRLEADRCSGAEATQALRRLEQRISSISKLYDLLDREDGIRTVGLDDYISEMAGTMAECRTRDGLSIKLSLDRIDIDVKRAASIGLIVNELLTNSLKHAFPEGGRGVIRVRLESRAGELVLAVEDDGIGMPPANLKDPPLGGFGLTLVALLTEQLHGRLETFSGKGFSCQLHFPL